MGEWNGPSELPVAELRRVAERADADGRPWTWTGGYPQSILRVGDVVLVAQTLTEPDAVAEFAEFIATFDPPTVLALLEMAERGAEGEAPSTERS